MEYVSGVVRVCVGVCACVCAGHTARGALGDGGVYTGLSQRIV